MIIFKIAIRHLSFIGCVLSTQIVGAHSQVVVIPLLGDDGLKLHNVVSVSKSGGDFDDPVKAMNSIANASSDNPYLIVLGPGIYNINSPIILKPNVNIIGSGRAISVIRSQGNTLPVISYASFFSVPSKIMVSGLSIQHLGPDIAIGFSGSGEGLTIKDVDILARANTRSIGIFDSFNPLSFLIDDVSINSIAKDAVGIEMAVTWDPAIRNTTIDVSGSNSSVGIRYWEGRNVIIANSEISALGNNSIGILEAQSLSPLPSETLKIMRSSISGSSAGVQRLSETGKTQINQSTLIGGYVDTSVAGTESCIASDNGEGQLVPSTCSVP